MSETHEPKTPYAYSFRSPSFPAPRTAEGSRDLDQEAFVSIKDTLLLLTGGCEISNRQDGIYCDKHQRYLKEGESRCTYLTERFADGERRSKAELQRYVNETLGIRDQKLVKRLTG